MPPKRAKPTTDAPPAETDAEADVQVHGEGAGAHDATNDAEPRTEDAATTDEKTTTTKDAGGERSPRGHVGQTPKGTSSAPSAAMDPMNYLLPEEQYANVRAMLAAAVNDVSTKLQNRTPSMMLYEHCQRSAKHGARERPHVLRWTETIDPTAEEDDDDAKTKKKKKPSTKATTKAKSEDVDAGEGAKTEEEDVAEDAAAAAAAARAFRCAVDVLDGEGDDAPLVASASASASNKKEAKQKAAAGAIEALMKLGVQAHEFTRLPKRSAAGKRKAPPEHARTGATGGNGDGGGGGVSNREAKRQNGGGRGRGDSWNGGRGGGRGGRAYGHGWAQQQQPNYALQRAIYTAAGVPRGTMYALHQHQHQHQQQQQQQQQYHHQQHHNQHQPTMMMQPMFVPYQQHPGVPRLPDLSGLIHDMQRGRGGQHWHQGGQRGRGGGGW